MYSHNKFHTVFEIDFLIKNWLNLKWNLIDTFMLCLFFSSLIWHWVYFWMYYDNTHIKNFKIDGHGIFTGSLNFNVTDEIGDLCPLHLDWPLHCIQIIYALCFTVSVSLKNFIK